MPRVVFTITAEAFDPDASEIDLKGPKLEEAVDEDINLFDAFFQSLGNDPLNGPERAIIKTYLAYKTGAARDHDEETQGAENA